MSLLFSICFVVSGMVMPDTVFNQTDANGLKQGFWRKKNDNGIIIYQGYFKDNNPVGKFIRYYEDGAVQSVMNFDNTGSKASTVVYYNDGSVAATGNYINKKKDSIWNYYSYYTHSLKSSEFYRNGVKDGIATVYYDSGAVYETQEWKNGKKDGKWIQYFSNGEVKAKGFFIENQMHGEYVAYFPCGQIYVSGQYVFGLKNGDWKYYDEKGQLKTTIHYVDGVPDNLDELEQKEHEYLENIEKLNGKIPEPTEENFLQKNIDEPTVQEKKITPKSNKKTKK